jgi:hypothetical protein
MTLLELRKLSLGSVLWNVQLVLTLVEISPLVGLMPLRAKGKQQHCLNYINI